MPRLPEFMKNVRSQKKELLINSVAENIRIAKQAINDEAKYYSPVWKKEMLQALKVEAKQALQEAIEEAKGVIKEYDGKISVIRNAPFSHSVNKEFLDNVNYTKTRILGELRLNPHNAQSILDMAVASKSGAQAVLELIESKQIDASLWSDDLYKNAFINSKSQAELEFELKKEQQVDALEKEKNNVCNMGHYLYAVKMLDNGIYNVSSMERQFDNDIKEIDKQLNGGM